MDAALCGEAPVNGGVGAAYDAPGRSSRPRLDDTRLSSCGRAARPSAGPLAAADLARPAGSGRNSVGGAALRIQGFPI